jgi:hypothetical protein
MFWNTYLSFVGHAAGGPVPAVELDFLNTTTIASSANATMMTSNATVSNSHLASAVGKLFTT